MEAIEQAHAASKMKAGAFAAVQHSYEKGRLRWALGVAAPVMLLPLVSWILSGRTVSQSLIGASLLLTVTLGAWRGLAWGRGVSIGLLAGLVPLACAHAARLYGHICTSTGCTTLCLPACVAGGVIAGLIAFVGSRRSPSPGMTLASEGGVAVLTGALGCACVGFSGIVGLVAGMGSTLLMGRLLAWRTA